MNRTPHAFARLGLCLGLVLVCAPRASAQGSSQAGSAAAGERAQASDSSDALYERGGLLGADVTLGLKLGAGFSQPFGDLGSAFLSELEVGYTLPVAQRAFALFVSGAYGQPSADKKNLLDARLPGPASYELRQQELMLTLGVTYRLHLPTNLIRPYASVGPRLFLMRTLISGQAGAQPFGDNRETATSIGLFGALGGELNVGPGAVLLELSLSWAKIDGYVLRRTSAGALGVAVGYRVFL